MLSAIIFLIIAIIVIMVIAYKLPSLPNDELPGSGYRPKMKPGQKPVNQTKPPQCGSGVPPKKQ